jgi:hypothetical protein
MKIKTIKGDIGKTQAHYSEGKHKLADCLHFSPSRLADHFFSHPFDMNVVLIY